MSTDAILSRARMIQTEVNVYKQEIAQLNYKVKDQPDCVSDSDSDSVSASASASASCR